MAWKGFENGARVSFVFLLFLIYVVVEQLQRPTSSHRSVSFVFPLYTVCGCGGLSGDAMGPYETCSFCFPLVLYTLEAVVVVEMMCLAALSPLFFFCYICLVDGVGLGRGG